MKNETLQKANELAGKIAEFETDLYLLNTIREQGGFEFAMVDPGENVKKSFILKPRFYPISVNLFLEKYMESLQEEKAKFQEQLDQL